MSNISSPNTTIGGGNFSPAQQQLQQLQQQQHQIFTPAATNNNNGIGAAPGSNTNNFLSFFNGGGNVSPTEGSIASDQTGRNSVINSITSNTAFTNSGISSVPPAKTTIIGNSGCIGSLAEDDFAAGIGTSTTYNNNFGFNASSASLNASTINSNGSNNCGVTNGCNTITRMMPNNNNANMMGINNNINNNSFNSIESPLKQQQFFSAQQNFSQQQHQLYQQQQQQKIQQQRNFNTANEMSSDCGNGDALFINSQPYSENSTACYGMPQSAPSLSQTIRNPFEEEEQLSSLKSQRSLSAKPGSMNTNSLSAPPLSSPSFFDHFRNQKRQMMPDLPQFNPGSYPPGSREHQLAVERYRLPYTFHASQRRQLQCPYPLQEIGPNGQPMSMMLRLPHSYIQMNPALMNNNNSINGKPPFFGLPGPHMVMTPAGPVLVGPNGQVIGPPRPSSIGTPQQQPNGCPTPSSNISAPISIPKKETKKRETKLTKKQQQMLQQQQQAEADLIRQQHQQPCSMINGMMMSGNSIGIPPLIDNNNGGFSTNGCRLPPNDLKQRLQHQNAMQHINGRLSPNNFKGFFKFFKYTKNVVLKILTVFYQ